MIDSGGRLELYSVVLPLTLLLQFQNERKDRRKEDIYER